MARSLIRPSTQVKTVDVFDDTKAPGIALEDPNGTMEDLLQAILSQLRRVIGDNWYDDVFAPGLNQRAACSPRIVKRPMVVAEDTACFYPNDFVINADGEIEIRSGGELVILHDARRDICDQMEESVSFIVHPNRFCIRHDLVLLDSVEIVIEDGGELLVI